MNTNPCDRIKQAALRIGPNSSAWCDWQEHATNCEACSQNEKVYQALRRLASEEASELGAARAQAIRTALVERHRHRWSNLWWCWPALALALGSVVITILFVPANEPFNLEGSATKWSQIATNPDWVWQPKHPLRHRIQSLRDDFRIGNSSSTEALNYTNLKDRLEKLRQQLASEE